MNKKIVKLAVLRDNIENPCPFGLNIPESCSLVGDFIDKLVPLDFAKTKEEYKHLKETNQKLFRWEESKSRCKYAGKIMDGKDVVECNFGSTDAGAQDGDAIVGSPFYQKYFSGVGMDGLYSFPMGYYVDVNIDHPYYYGLYSLEGIAKDDISEQVSKTGLEKSANKK